MMMGGFGGGMGGLGLIGGLFSTLLTIGVLVGLVFLGIWLWRRFSALEGVGSWTQSLGTRQPTAREILQARYAHGELTREEYQSMLQDLA
jgi:putative membrane protein